jgi:hypothetical protein
VKPFFSQSNLSNVFQGLIQSGRLRVLGYFPWAHPTQVQFPGDRVCVATSVFRQGTASAVPQMPKN